MWRNTFSNKILVLTGVFFSLMGMQKDPNFSLSGKPVVVSYSFLVPKTKKNVTKNPKAFAQKKNQKDEEKVQEELLEKSQQGPNRYIAEFHAVRYGDL